MLKKTRDRSVSDKPAFRQLTPREIEILKLIAAGLSTKEIAVSLGISFKTAACHRSRLMDKLGIHEIANLTRYAVRRAMSRRARTVPIRHRRNRSTESD
jgi:DNA-binding NarL/FixJ family response regulator